MSLEERLAECTAAIQALTTAMQTVGNPFPAASNGAPAPIGAAVDPAKKGPGRPKKEAAPAGATIPETGDPVGTLYYYNAQHDTAFSVKPGEKSTVAGVAITAAEFVAKAEAAKLKASVAANADPFASADPVDPFAGAESAAPAAPPKTVQEVTDKLMEINASVMPGRGRDGVMSVLKKHGISNVGGLVGKDTNAIFADAEKLLASGSL